MQHRQKKKLNHRSSIDVSSPSKHRQDAVGILSCACPVITHALDISPVMILQYYQQGHCSLPWPHQPLRRSRPKPPEEGPFDQHRHMYIGPSQASRRS
jgi:hypothetical protein